MHYLISFTLLKFLAINIILIISCNNNNYRFFMFFFNYFWYHSCWRFRLIFLFLLLSWDFLSYLNFLYLFIMFKIVSILGWHNWWIEVINSCTNRYSSRKNSYSEMVYHIQRSHYIRRLRNSWWNGSRAVL